MSDKTIELKRERGNLEIDCSEKDCVILYCKESKKETNLIILYNEDLKAVFEQIKKHKLEWLK